MRSAHLCQGLLHVDGPLHTDVSDSIRVHEVPASFHWLPIDRRVPQSCVELQRPRVVFGIDLHVHLNVASFPGEPLHLTDQARAQLAATEILPDVEVYHLGQVLCLQGRPVLRLPQYQAAEPGRPSISFDEQIAKRSLTCVADAVAMHTVVVTNRGQRRDVPRRGISNKNALRTECPVRKHGLSVAEPGIARNAPGSGPELASMPSAKGIRAGRAFVELSADDSKLVRVTAAVADRLSAE